METNSLFGGTASLSGLFFTCLDALEKISTYRAFSEDSKALETQFRANKLRLQKWGQAVGFDNEELLYDHHPALNDDETISMVEDILQIINGLSQANGAVPERLGRVGGRLKADQGRSPGRHSASKRERAAWAIFGKGKREDDVKLFSELIQQLHNLVPPSVEERLPPYKTPQDKSESQTSVLSEVKQFLSRREHERKVELRRDLQSWILGVHSSTDIFEEIAQKRLHGTCDWILQNPEFSSWLANHSSSPAPQLFWIHGPAGFGKTILFARVVEYLSEISIPLVAQFFFSSDFESRKDPFAAIRSWLCQIMRQEPTAFEIIYDTWLAQEAQILSERAIENLFIDVLKTTPGCILALDGLDECPSIEKVVKLVARAVQKPNIRVLIVSRGEPEILEALQEHTDDNFGEYKISIEDVRADTALYSREVVNQKLSNKSDAIRGDIASRMSDRCDGQFLWVKMQADSLRKGMNQMQLQRKISETPTGLAHFYERNWDSIIQQQKEERLRAVTLLRWAAFSLRPLTVSEITEAALVEDDSTEVPIEELPDELDTYYVNSEIVGLCGSLIELRGNKEFVDSMTVHVTHFSVKQFLLLKIASPERFKEFNADLNASYEMFQNAFLAKKCLQYISFARVWDNTENGKLWNPGTSFRVYAANAWFRHAVLVQNKDIKMTESINNFFGSATGNWDAWRRWYDTTTIKNLTDKDPEPSPLHYACELCLTETLKYLLEEHNHDVNQVGWARKETPLGVACEMGHEVLVQTLLKSGASFSIENCIGRTPLYSLAKVGNVGLVRLALSNGAEPNWIDKSGWTPLHAAASLGNYEVAKQLLEKGANMIQTEIGTPLSIASAAGNTNLVRLFLENGTALNSSYADGWTPLITAVRNGHLDVIKLLLTKSPNLDVSVKFGWTALHIATNEGRKDIAQLLLEKGSNTEVMVEEKWTPIHFAVRNGDLEMVKCLAERGSNIQSVDISGYAPLHHVAKNGHLEIVKFLLEKGVNIEVKNNYGWTPLHSASWSRHIDILKLFLNSGANPKATATDGRTPLDVSSNRGYLEAVKLLLDSGADPDVADICGCTPLHAASWRGHLEVIKLLLENGASSITKTHFGETVLCLASTQEHLDVVKYLLGEGFDVNIRDKSGCTPLLNVSRVGNIEIFNLLLEESLKMIVENCEQPKRLHMALENEDQQRVVHPLPGSNSGSLLHATDSCGRTPLFLAARFSYGQLVRACLDRVPSFLHTKDWCGSRALAAAVRNGHIAVVKQLLDFSDVDPNMKDKFGRTCIWWAKNQGYTQISKLLSRRSEERGIPIDDTEASEIYKPRPFQADNWWCDVCLLSLSDYNDLANFLRNKPIKR